MFEVEKFNEIHSNVNQSSEFSQKKSSLEIL